MIPKIKRLLGNTKNAILATGALAGAVVAVYSAGTMLTSIWDSSSRAKPLDNANIKEANVEPNVLLEQYEYLNQPGATESADDGSQPRPAGHRLANYGTSTSARSAIVVVADVSAGSTATIATSPASTPPKSGASLRIGNHEDTTEKGKEETEEEKIARKKAEETKAKEEAEAKAEEEAKVKEEEARAKKEEKAKEAKKIEEAAKAIAAEKKQKEDEEVSKEDSGSHSSNDKGGSEVQGGKNELPTYVPPPPSPTPPHREGDTEVVIGTGARTSEVDAVIRKAKAILATDKAVASTGGPVFSDAVFHTGAPTAFSEVSAGESTAPLALPSRCGPKCALRPTVDQAILDAYSNLAQAAQAIAADFTESRERVFEHKPQPVGVTVDYTVDVVGFLKRRLTLEWTLYDRATKQSLPKAWWHNVIVKQIWPQKPTTHVPGNFWAPIPPTPGDYYFKLRVFVSDKTGENTHAITEDFH